MKISLITVVYNGEAFLSDCIQSVANQTYQNLEYIVIDGLSTDKTVSIIESNKNHVSQFISEKDDGLYDALNKGISLATGDIIGILNSDDMLATNNILDQVAQVFFKDDTIDGVYGDLNYIHPFTKKVVREWKSKPASFKDVESGWMPAHPTLYLKKELFEHYGKYALDMGTAADYDLILRFFHTHKINAAYLPSLMVNMRMGGVSNKTIKNILLAVKNDLRALFRNKIPNPFRVLLRKKLSKISQFKQF